MYQKIQPRPLSDHSLDLSATTTSAQGQMPKNGSGWWRQLLNNSSQHWTVENTR